MFFLSTSSPKNQPLLGHQGQFVAEDVKTLSSSAQAAHWTHIIRTAGKTTTTVAKVHTCYCSVAAQILKDTGTSALFSLIQKDSTLWDTSSFLKNNF